METGKLHAYVESVIRVLAPVETNTQLCTHLLSARLREWGAKTKVLDKRTCICSFIYLTRTLGNLEERVQMKIENLVSLIPLISA